MSADTIKNFINITAAMRGNKPLIYARVCKVSRSGTSRSVAFHMICKEQATLPPFKGVYLYDLTPAFCSLLDKNMDNRGGMIVRGVGTNVALEVVQLVSQKLYGNPIQLEVEWM